LPRTTQIAQRKAFFAFIPFAYFALFAAKCFSFF